MPMDLKRCLYLPVAKRLRERADSLRQMRRFPRSGIEGWLKVEVVAALGEKVTTLQNKGPDICLSTGERVELKAATNLDRTCGAVRENTTRLASSSVTDETRSSSPRLVETEWSWSRTRCSLTVRTSGWSAWWCRRNPHVEQKLRPRNEVSAYRRLAIRRTDKRPTNNTAPMNAAT